MSAEDINKKSNKNRFANDSGSNADEISELRAEVIQLRSEQTTVARPLGWRWVTAIILTVVACVMAPLAVTAVWLNRNVMDTDTYVSTIAPLSKDKAIQGAVATAVSVELFKRVNAEKIARQALPAQASFLAGPIADSLKGFVHTSAQKIVATPQFQRLWVKTNSVAHKEAVTLITGDGRASISQSGKVKLDLSGALANVSSSLKRRGIDIFASSGPLAGGKITLLDSPVLGRIKGAVSTLNNLALWLPTLVIGSLIGAVALSPKRLRIVLWEGVGVAISMVVLLAGIIIMRSYYLDAVVGGFITKSAATAFFDTIIRSLRSAGITIFVFGAVVAGGAALAGSSATATKLRSSLSGTGAGLDLGPVGAWIFDYKGALRALGLVAGFIALVLWNEPTPVTVLGIAIVELIYLGALEVLGQELPADADAGKQEKLKAG